MPWRRSLSREKEQELVDKYASGMSLLDLQAEFAAKNENISDRYIRNIIVNAGGTIRTMSETMRMKKQKYLNEQQ